ncbi:MAG: cytochrome c biogenesis CcdA family protein [Halobacteriaceae archaeon]
MTAADALRVGFAFTAGAATFFAPCSFPLLPGYVGYYLGQDDDPGPVTTRLRRAAVVGVVTSLGFFAVYAVLAGVVAAVGTRALANISVLELVVGALLVVLGGAMALGRFDPAALHVPLPERERSPTGFFLFGVVYAAAAAGCTAPVFVGIASVALSGGPVGAVLTLGAYAAGMSVLMVVVTGLSALGKDALLRTVSRNTGRISRAAGVLLVGAGVAQIYLFLFEFGGMRILFG